MLTSKTITSITLTIRKFTGYLSKSIKILSEPWKNFPKAFGEFPALGSRPVKIILTVKPLTPGLGAKLNTISGKDLAVRSNSAKRNICYLKKVKAVLMSSLL